MHPPCSKGSIELCCGSRLHAAVYHLSVLFSAHAAAAVEYHEPRSWSAQLHSRSVELKVAVPNPKSVPGARRAEFTVK